MDRSVFITTIVVLVSAVSSSKATPIVTLEDTGNGIQRATGIIGLEVMEMIFDVTFHPNVSYDTLYADQDPFFLGDFAGAAEAAAGIASALNALADIPTTNAPPDDIPGASAIVYIPVAFEPFNDLYIAEEINSFLGSEWDAGIRVPVAYPDEPQSDVALTRFEKITTAPEASSVVLWSIVACVGCLASVRQRLLAVAQNKSTMEIA